MESPFEENKKQRAEATTYDESEFIEEVNIKGDYEKLIESIGKENFIIGVFGDIFTGKTKYSMEFAKVLANNLNKPVFFKGLEDDEVPEGFTRFENMDEVPDNVIIIYDEMGCSGNCRRSNSKENIKLVEEFKKLRHRGWVMIYIDQSSRGNDVGLYERIQVFILKEPSITQLEMERGVTKQLYERCKEYFNKEDNRPIACLFSKRYEGVINLQLKTENI